MIDGYKTKEGKVIVVDYDSYNNKSEEERKYQDNIEELLMAENVREYLYDYRDKVNTSIDNKKNVIKEAIVWYNFFCYYNWTWFKWVVFFNYSYFRRNIWCYCSYFYRNIKC